MTLTCQRCGRSFERPHVRGPEPKWCSGACRTAAFASRHPERSQTALKAQVAYYRSALHQASIYLRLGYPDKAHAEITGALREYF